MKNKLLFRKAVTQLFLSLCLMLFCANTSWGQAQTIGSFPYVDGGFEGQAVGALADFNIAATSTAWTKTAASGASSIGSTGARTGSRYATGNITNTSVTRVLNSPTVASGFPVAASSYVIQYYIKNADMASIPVGIGNTGSGYVSPSVTTSGATWLKYTQVVTSNAAAVPATPVYNTYVGIGRVKVTAPVTTQSFLVDDVVVYAGTAADGDAPLAASGGAVSGLNVSWTASSDVDGGGYMVVRYATNPNANNDPNANGIYAVGNTITNGDGSLVGTVVYIGTATSFTDAVSGSVSGSDYYKIYTVDKAFNYATEIKATAVVSSTPTITSSIETLTGFNYTGVGPSASQSFVVSGSNLTNNLVVSTTSTDFELSTNNFASAGSSSITLSGATVASTTISVRSKANLLGGVKSATVSIASTGANTLPTLSLSGTVQAVYFYNGSGLVSSNTSWGANSDGTGANPTAVTDTYTNFVIANGNATTNASWTLGSNSKVIVGNGSAVSLTVADTFPIIGTIDAAANGSVVWQHVLATLPASPTFGTLDNASEVHFAPAVAASYSFGATTAYGKLFIDGAGEVSVSNTASTPTVKTALTVASGSTLSFTSNNNPTISVNAAATATINGTVKTSKPAGLFVAGGSIPLNATATLVLGTSSTIEFSRTGALQTVTALPTGVNYANLILSDGGANAAAAKTIAAPFTVNGTLTINLATPAFSTISAVNNITMANGATVVMISGVLGAIPSFANGSKFNVTYSGNGKTQIIGATTASSTNVTLTSSNAAIVAGMTVTGTTIAAGTTVASISGTALVLSAAATVTSATPQLTFGTAVPQTTGVDLPTVANDALGNLTFDNPAGVVLSSAVKANTIITAKTNTITLNTADFLDANVQVNGNSELTLNVSANQANLKQIVFSAATTAKLKLITTSTSTIAFANSSAQNWGTGTVEITGFVEGNIRFGSSNSALTATQLGLIKDTADLTKTFKLSDQGYLYYSTTLVPGDAFVVTSTNPVYLASGVASTYVITTTNSPTSFVLADPTNNPLPAGLTLNATTGAIEGTPTVSVTDFVVAITISNSVDTTNTINFTFNVKTRDAQAITWNDDLSGSRTYGDAAIALTATTDAPALSVSYSSSNTAVATISGSTLTIVGPGNTTITASQAGNPDYSPATNLTKELVVNTKVLTISGAVASGKIYDKTTTAAIIGTLAGGLVGADVVTLVLSGTFADANAGIDKPVTSTSSLTGADAAKYSLTQPSGLTATITKADQLLAALGTSSFKILGDADYDPIPLVTDSNVTGLTSVALENPNFTYTSSNESVATIVGGKVHIVGLGSTTIIGEQAGSLNYNASLPVTQTLKVLPAPLAAWDLYNFNPTAGQQSVSSVNASQVAAGISVTPSLSMGNMANVTNAGNRYRFTSSDWPYLVSSSVDSPSINLATGKYMSVAIAADLGKILSLSSINASFRGGTISSELKSQFAYSIDGTNFTLIGENPTTFAGASGTRFYSDIDLSGIAALQNLPSGTIVTLRYYASGKSSGTTSTIGQKAWGFFSDFVENNTRALIIGGSLVTAAPTASAQTFCASATVASLTASGTAIKWYAAATGGSALASDLALEAGTYYATQTLNGAESARTAVAVTVQAAPNAGTNGTLSLSASPSDADLFAALTGADTGGSWSRPSSGYVGVYTYTVNAISPCTVNATSTVTVSVSTLLPAAGTTYNLCAGAKISNLLAAATASNGSVGVKVYATATGVTPIVLSGATDAVIPTSTTPKAYWLTEPAGTTSGESAKVQINVIVNALPVTPSALVLTNDAAVLPATSTTAVTAVGVFVGSDKPLKLTATAAGAVSYKWTLPSGVVRTNSTGTTTDSDATSTEAFIYVKFTGSASASPLVISVQSVNANGCTSVAKPSASLTRLLPAAPGALAMNIGGSNTTAITSFAKYMGSSTVLRLSATASVTATSYLWELPTGVNRMTALEGGSVTTDLTSTDPYIFVNFAGVTKDNTDTNSAVAVLTKVLRIGVKSVNGVGSSTTVNSGLLSTAKLLTLTAVAPAAPASLAMNNGVNTTAITVISKMIGQGATVKLLAPISVLASSYAWELPACVTRVTDLGGSIADNASTSTDPFIYVKFNGTNPAAGFIYLGVKAVNGVGSSVTANIGLESTAKLLKLATVVPAAPASLAMNNGLNTTAITVISKMIGQGATVKLLAATSALAISYAWEIPSCVTRVTDLGGSTADNTSTSTDPFIYVKFNGTNPAAGSIYFGVTAVNGVGSSVTNNSASTVIPATASTAKLLKLVTVVPAAPATLVLNDLASATPTTAVAVVSKYVGSSATLKLIAAASVLANTYSWELPSCVTRVSDLGGFTADNTSTSTDPFIYVKFNGTTPVAGLIYFGVKAVNSIGSSITANTGTNITRTDKLLAVTGGLPVVVAAVSGSLSVCNRSEGFSYTITAPVGATSYIITAPAGSVVSSTNGVSSATSTSSTNNVLTTSDLTFKVIYNGTAAFSTTDKSLVIRSANAFGPCLTTKALALTKQATCSSLTSIVRLVASTEEFNVIAYPNPSSDVFTLDVQSSSKGATGVQVYDMAGRLIENLQVNSDSVEVGRNYESGIYNVIVNKGANVKTLRVIKN